ncbi:hypothetical protein JCM16303_005350 [Sporobolomyces ruberrimus]
MIEVDTKFGLFMSGLTHQFVYLRPADDETGIFDLLIGPLVHHRTEDTSSGFVNTPTSIVDSSSHTSQPELANLAALEDQPRLLLILLGLFYPQAYEKIGSVESVKTAIEKSLEHDQPKLTQDVKPSPSNARPRNYSKVKLPAVRHLFRCYPLDPPLC